VIGLYLVQRPHIGRLGQLSSAAYAYSYVFFTGTVVYALADGTSDYNALSHDLQPWMTIHGTIMVLAGLGFGFAVIRAKVLPPWTAHRPDGRGRPRLPVADPARRPAGAGRRDPRPRIRRHGRRAVGSPATLPPKSPQEGPASGTVPAATAETPALAPQ
jgi:hypothetical protein